MILPTSSHPVHSRADHYESSSDPADPRRRDLSSTRKRGLYCVCGGGFTPLTHHRGGQTAPPPRSRTRVFRRFSAAARPSTTFGLRFPRKESTATRWARRGRRVALTVAVHAPHWPRGRKCSKDNGWLPPRRWTSRRRGGHRRAHRRAAGSGRAARRRPRGNAKRT